MRKRSWIAILILLLLVFNASSILAATDMSAHNILGLRIAMSEDEARKVINEMEGKSKVAEMESKRCEGLLYKFQ